MSENDNFYKKINIISFLAIIFALFILNLLFSNKSGISERENRELAAMPNLTASSYVDGSFFKDYEVYFADRFVFRDSLIGFSDTIMSYKGYAADGIEIVTTDANLINGVDNIDNDNTNIKDIEENMDNQYNQKDNELNNRADKEAEEDIMLQEAQEEAKKAKEAEIAEKEANTVTATGQFIIVNNTGYETFTYNEYFMSFYYSAINYFADNLNEDVAIYSILAPTSIEFNLPEKYASLTDSQKDGITYVNEKFRDRIINVDVYSNLEKFRDEYLYFKTDHHWTALGAYRAYESFMIEKGEAPVSLDEYDKIKSNEKYLGSIYSMTSSKKLEKNKDDIWYYKINDPITYEVHDKNNEVTYGKSVFYPRYFNREGKYAVFMGGDVPFAKITTNHTDKKKIMIIKDSYANAFIPFLIPHYSEIYVADPRSCKYNIIDTIDENSIDELLFVDYAMALKLTGFSDMIKNLAVQNSEPLEAQEDEEQLTETQQP